MKKLTGFIKLALFAGVLFTSCESISQEESLIRDIPACVSGKIVFSNSDDSSGAAVFIVKQNADKSSAVSKGNVKAISKKISASSSEKSFRSALDESGIEKCFLTQKDGNFRFEGLEGGFYRIFVYYDNSLEKVKERTVLLTKNHELILADFNFTKTCAVKGTLNFGADSEIEKNGFSVMVEGFSQVSLTDTEGNYYLSDVPLSSNLKLVVSKNEVSYPVFLEIPESNGVYETENDIELKNFIPESNDDELQSESADKNAEIKLFNYRGSYLSADEIDEVNEYDFYFNESDGSSYIFIDGVWVLFAKGGRDGFNGIDGKNGRDGIDGVNGKDGRDGIDGKDGQNGVNGKDGRDGIDGKNGLDGKDGLNGKDGRDGIDGKNGSDGKDAVCLFEVLSVKKSSVSSAKTVVLIQVFSQFDVEKVIFAKDRYANIEDFFASEKCCIITEVEGEYSFEVSENGFYTAGVQDVNGNRTWKTVEVNCISDEKNIVSENDEPAAGEKVESETDKNTETESIENGEGISDVGNGSSGETVSENVSSMVGKVIVFENGLFYGKNVEDLSEKDKENAAAVCFGVSKEGKVLGLALSNSYAEKSQGKLAWAVSDSFGASYKFEKLVCVPSSNMNPESFEGETSGKNSYEEIKALDADGSLNAAVLAEIYPSIAYAYGYGEKSSIKDGWYLPSIWELYNIYLNLETVNSVLTALNGTPMAVTSVSTYYSSSQSENASKVYKMSMASGKITEGSKTVSRDAYACAVREFEIDLVSEEE